GSACGIQLSTFPVEYVPIRSLQANSICGKVAALKRGPIVTSRCFVYLTFAAALGVSALNGQGLTGQISGSVEDSSASAIAGATVELTNTGTGLVKAGTTDASGAFIFPQLLAGTYNIRVTSAGFKAYQQKGIELASSERSVLRTIVLEVGALSESV